MHPDESVEPNRSRDLEHPVVFWRKGDNRVRVGLHFYVFSGVGVEPDLVALPVGLRFDVSRWRAPSGNNERGPEVARID
jgi:hypothetical protein